MKWQVMKDGVMTEVLAKRIAREAGRELEFFSWPLKGAARRSSSGDWISGWKLADGQWLLYNQSSEKIEAVFDTRIPHNPAKSAGWREIVARQLDNVFGEVAR